MNRKEALFYLVGALRDGSVYKYEKTRNYYIVWYSSNKAYLQNSIIPRIKALGFENAKVYQYRKRHYRVRISSKNLYEIIVGEFAHPINTGSKKVPWPTPRPVKEAPIKLQLEYAKGFVDAEGSIIKSSKGFQIDISQQCKEPLEFLAKIFGNLGIQVTGIYRGKDGTWRLRIASRQSIIRFHEIVGFRHPCKRRRLITLLRGNLPRAQHT